MQYNKKIPRISPKDHLHFYKKIMQEMGLEPTRGRPRQILSLMRLPLIPNLTERNLI